MGGVKTFEEVLDNARVRVGVVAWNVHNEVLVPFWQSHLRGHGVHLILAQLGVNGRQPICPEPNANRKRVCRGANRNARNVHCVPVIVSQRHSQRSVAFWTGVWARRLLECVRPQNVENACLDAPVLLLARPLFETQWGSFKSNPPGDDFFSRKVVSAEQPVHGHGFDGGKVAGLVVLLEVLEEQWADVVIPLLIQRHDIFSPF